VGGGKHASSEDRGKGGAADAALSGPPFEAGACGTGEEGDGLGGPAAPRAGAEGVGGEVPEAAGGGVSTGRPSAAIPFGLADSGGSGHDFFGGGYIPKACILEV